MNKVLIGIGLVVALALAAVLIGPSFIDWNAYKSEIVAAAREATGRDVAIDGDLSLRLLPRPELTAEGLRLANIEGGSNPDMLRIAALDVRLAFAPLLSGRIQVEQIRLVEPTVLLEVTADGRSNWILETAAKEPASDSTAAPDGDGEALNLSLDAIELENARIVYRDARSGVEESLTGLSATASAGSLQGPFRASGRISVREAPLTFDLAVGTLEPGQPLPLRLVLRLDGTPGEAVVTLTASNLDSEPSLKGEVKLSAERVGALAAIVAPGTALPGLVDQPLSLSAQIAGTASQVGINDLTLALGDMRAAGAVSIDLTQGIGVDAALEVSRLDLDALLARADGAAKPAKAGPASGDGGPADAAMPQFPTLPADLHGTISLGIDGVTFRERVIRQVQLSLALDGGRAELRQASALLPGGSDFRLSGAVANEADEPAFKGRAEVSSDNLRGLLDWLAVDVGQVPAGRLSNLKLTAAIDARPSLVQIADLNLRLDNSTVTGGVAVRVQKRPSFGLSLSVDRLNLDGYLPRAQPAVAGATPAPGGAVTDATAGGRDGPLAALEDFDTNFRLQVGRLTYSGVEMRDIALELTLFGGTLTLKQASVADAAGAAITASGAATGFAAKPAVDIRTEVKAADLAGLAKSFSLGDALDWRRVSGINLAGVLNGTAETLVFSVNGQAAGGEVTLRGTARDPQAVPDLDINLVLSHPDLGGLLSQLGLVEAGRPGGGALALTLTARGKPERLALTLAGDVAGLALNSDGTLSSTGDSREFDLKVEAKHADLVAMLRALGTDYRPALENIGGLAFSAAVKGTPAAMTVDGIRAALGPARFEGKAALTLDRPTPYVNADLTANEIIVDLFLPQEPASAAATPGAGSGGAARSSSQSNDRRWSRAPLDLTGMAAVDADVTLAAAGLVFRQYPFVKPRMVMHLEDGALTIRELKGGLFGGNIGLSALVESRPVTAFALNTKLVGADIEEALKTAVGLDTVTGRLDFQGSFKARGNSQWDLVNGLEGTAELHAANGVIRGFDMRSFSDRMQKLTEGAHFIDLVSRTFSGGQTAYSSVDGTWQIERGVARTADTRAMLDAAEATLTGAVALPPWRLDLQSRMRLTEHANAPNMGVDLSGPIDAPRHNVKTAELERWLLGRAARELLPKALGKKGGDVGKLLEGVLGGGQPAQNDQSGGSGGQAAPAIDNLLRGLLKK